MFKGSVLPGVILTLAICLLPMIVLFRVQPDTNRRTDKEEFAATQNLSSVYDVLVVGAGLSGAVIAERLASQCGLRILVIDQRPHIGGNCYDYVDHDTGILISKYGLHLFHTNLLKVWSYINQFSVWKRWDHTALAYVEGQYAPLPVNIRTVNSLMNLSIASSLEMDEWLSSVQILPKSGTATNSEEMALSRVGLELYQKIFFGYTKKQWDKNPIELGPEVTARIPVRNNFDDRYFNDRYQALPRDGYTKFFERLLDHENITILLNTSFRKFKVLYSNIIYRTLYFTGPIDQFFEDEGKLEYRSLSFEKQVFWNHTGYVQPASQINFPGFEVNFTRSVEYKWFLHQKSPHSIVFREFSNDKGEPYYPVPTARNRRLYLDFQLRSLELGSSVIFVGRLANFKYFNMDQAIENALSVFEKTRPSGNCMTYENRYERCLWLLNNTEHTQQRKLFQKRYDDAVEVVILRSFNTHVPWSKDYWLNVCSFVLEASTMGTRRDVILSVEEGGYVPEEFSDLAIYHNSKEVKNRYPHFINGKVHGDIIVADLLLNNSQYGYAWVFEDDCRYIGVWNSIFEHRETDLVFIYQKSSFQRKLWWTEAKYYHGKWNETKPKALGTLTVAFGMSRKAADNAISLFVDGTYNDNQEVNLITGAWYGGLNFSFLDVKREIKCCTTPEIQNMYTKWMNGTCLEFPLLVHAVKLP